MEQLKQTDIPVLSEEGKNIPFKERRNWSQLWIVDPIDGTKEFIKKNGEFTVNIALIENKIPILGVIYAPALQTLYYGTEGKACKVENVTLENYSEKVKFLKRLPLPQTLRNKSNFTVVASKSHLSPETEVYIDSLKRKYGDVVIISKGSSLKLCLVAEGVANEYPRFAPTMEWDTAAGQAICSFAGYDVIDWVTKKTMLYNRENLMNPWFLVK
jgi:3'(2'), 5'-bisphosphate nucleotidase